MASLKSRSRDKHLTKANPSVSREEEIAIQSTSFCTTISLQMPSRPTGRDIAFRCRTTPPSPQTNFLSNCPERHLSTKYSASVLRRRIRSENLHL